MWLYQSFTVSTQQNSALYFPKLLASNLVILWKPQEKKKVAFSL
jgi:hypothetical protein